MRILVVDTYYPQFVQSLYASNPKLRDMSYYRQRDAILEKSFGTADYYSRGFEQSPRVKRAEDIIANAAPLQEAWSRDVLGVPRKQEKQILYDQIDVVGPNVLYVQDVGLIPADQLDHFKKSGIVLAAQISCPMPPKENIRRYDVIFSSFPHYIAQFQAMGVRAEYVRLAFDPVVLVRSQPLPSRTIPASFVGGVVHNRWWSWGNKVLEALAKSVPQVEFYGYGYDTLPAGWTLKKRWRGEAWGLDMYNKYLSSRIVVNRHGEVAWPNANNMRLYEATGCGALLITDKRDGLEDIFEIGKEVVVFEDEKDLISKVKYYMANPEEATEIAEAGMYRTLGEHTYKRRMAHEAEVLYDIWLKK